MFRVWSDSFFGIRLDYGRKIVLLTRTERGFTSSAELGQAYARLAHELRAYTVTSLGILIDARNAPPIDPSLEAEFVRLNAVLFGPFRTCAVFVRPAGVAQGRRIRARTAIGTTLVTSSIAEASVHLGLDGVLDLHERAVA